jgi:betaine lipid synthase
VIDSLSTLLAPAGVISVADFYVQSSTNITAKTSITGGVLGRHVNWFSRQFWRIWFEFDRVNLDEGRRDYLEYRFGTVLSVNER